MVRILAVVTLLGTGGREARAAPTELESAEAKRHHAIATRAYDLAEYEAALREFKEAYRFVDDPAFLFNIAQCHRKLGHPTDAITFYRTYLRRAPATPYRADVEKLIADLEKETAGRPEAPATLAPPPAAPAQAAAPLAPSPASAPAALVVVPAQAAREASRPVYARAWFWVVAGAVVAGAATTVFLLTRSDPAATPGPFACPDCAATTPIGSR